MHNPLFKDSLSDSTSGDLPIGRHAGGNFQSQTNLTGNSQSHLFISHSRDFLDLDILQKAINLAIDVNHLPKENNLAIDVNQKPAVSTESGANTGVVTTDQTSTAPTRQALRPRHRLTIDRHTRAPAPSNRDVCSTSRMGGLCRIYQQDSLRCEFG
jgi:hypothetical protein